MQCLLLNHLVIEATYMHMGVSKGGGSGFNPPRNAEICRIFSKLQCKKIVGGRKPPETLKPPPKKIHCYAHALLTDSGAVSTSPLCRLTQ